MSFCIVMYSWRMIIIVETLSQGFFSIALSCNIRFCDTVIHLYGGIARTTRSINAIQH